MLCYVCQFVVLARFIAGGICVNVTAALLLNICLSACVGVHIQTCQQTDYHFALHASMRPVFNSCMLFSCVALPNVGSHAVNQSACHPHQHPCLGPG